MEYRIEKRQPTGWKVIGPRGTVRTGLTRAAAYNIAAELNGTPRIICSVWDRENNTLMHHYSDGQTGPDYR